MTALLRNLDTNASTPWCVAYLSSAILGEFALSQVSVATFMNEATSDLPFDIDHGLDEVKDKVRADEVDEAIPNVASVVEVDAQVDKVVESGDDVVQ